MQRSTQEMKLNLQKDFGHTDENITVITITRGRPNYLQRAAESVQRQDYQGSITHYILIDDCTSTRSFVEERRSFGGQVEWHLMPRMPGERSGPSRLAKLRNYAVQEAKTKWISFLDDDNEFEDNHISSLVECAIVTGSEAVHSQRKLFLPDGRPYLECIWPWSRDINERLEIYQQLCQQGVLEPGSNIEKDRCDPLEHPDPVRIVDTSEWLLRRSLLERYPFNDEYTYEDWANITTEDDKLLQQLVRERIPIYSTKKPTLKYYLGGYSNSFDVDQLPNAWD